ncbi:MAG: SDR family NAD(P)-dependent oxidoreductase, partial [Chloroflexi bacterium]|nr:SDR family NAD(P)-dependent oxidoreductase [Chloroflexota bacterium]
MLLEGKVAVIAGAGRGIGRAIALAMAGEGAAVVVTDYGVSLDGREPSSEPANEVVAAIQSAGGRAVANAESVATMAGAESMVQAALGSFGRIDLLVNSAGILRDRMFHNMT